MGKYIYNGNGQRVEKWIPSENKCTIFHYDQNGLLIAESTSTGTVTNEYVYLNGSPFAKINSKVSGAGYNSPDPAYPLFRASLSLNVNTSSLGTSSLKYYYTRMRLELKNTSITGLTIAGNTATITGVGTVNRVIGTSKETFTGTFTATIIDGNSDAMGIEIRKPDGTLYYSAGSQTISSGNYTIGSNIYYYHNDHLGTPMIMTDSTGSVVWQGEFKPFGESLSITASVTNNLRFPGQYYDNETGLHQNWNRDYKTEIGRYETPDLSLTLNGNSNIPYLLQQQLENPQELNQFVYAKNDPINYLDRTGKYVEVGTRFFYPVPIIIKGIPLYHLFYPASSRIPRSSAMGMNPAL